MSICKTRRWDLLKGLLPRRSRLEFILCNHSTFYGTGYSFEKKKKKEKKRKCLVVSFKGRVRGSSRRLQQADDIKWFVLSGKQLCWEWSVENCWAEVSAQPAGHTSCQEMLLLEMTLDIWHETTCFHQEITTDELKKKKTSSESESVGNSQIKLYFYHWEFWENWLDTVLAPLMQCFSNCFIKLRQIFHFEKNPMSHHQPKCYKMTLFSLLTQCQTWETCLSALCASKYPGRKWEREIGSHSF